MKSSVYSLSGDLKSPIDQNFVYAFGISLNDLKQIFSTSIYLSYDRKVKKRLANIKQCSACTVKSEWIYLCSIPFTEYPLLLCDTDLIDQFHSLSPEDKQKVKILQ